MRLLSGNPGMYQHSVEHNTEGETTQHEPEHGEDTIARVKGTETLTAKMKLVRKAQVGFLPHLEALSNMLLHSALLCRPSEGSSEEVSVHSGRSRRGQSGATTGAAVRVRRA